MEFLVVEIKLSSIQRVFYNIIILGNPITADEKRKQEILEG